MKVRELTTDSAAMAAIKKFVLDPNFPTIKDAFVSNCPRGGKDGTEIIHNSGKAEGNVYVFNELEALVKTKPKTETPKREGQDPDLKDE